MKRLYTFLDEEDKVIERVLAEEHDEAVEKANGWQKEDKPTITRSTDFYSEEVDL